MSLFSKVSGAGIAAAALLAFAPAAAQPPAEPDPAPRQEMEAPTGTRIMTVIGAIKDPDAPQAPAVREDTRVPELPVVYEDDQG
jgi:hypothetical protein